MKPFLQFALFLACVIAASKVAGAASKRMGQPAVFGELLMGLLLGPTLLNLLHLFPAQEHIHGVVKDLAELGVVFLMFLAGLETELDQMRKVGLAALLGATGGVGLPFIAGTGISLAFGYQPFESVFIGTILTATSVSISAQTLLELGRLRSKEGTTILGAAVIDDVMGIIVLSLVVALHAAQAGEAAVPVWLVLLKMALYFVGAIVVGRLVVPTLLRATRDWPGSQVPLAFAVVLGLLFSVTAEWFGQVAAITGSYTLGVLIAQHHDLKHLVEDKLQVMAYGFFVPIFFISIGLEANLFEALGKSGAMYMTLIVVAAIATKVVGSGLGVKLVNFSWDESLKVGIGMVSRGEVALIIAGIGLGARVIDQAVYSVMIVMTLITTLVTPVLLRLAFRERARSATPPAAGH